MKINPSIFNDNNENNINNYDYYEFIIKSKDLNIYHTTSVMVMPMKKERREKEAEEVFKRVRLFMG